MKFYNTKYKNIKKQVWESWSVDIVYNYIQRRLGIGTGFRAVESESERCASNEWCPQFISTTSDI